MPDHVEVLVSAGNTVRIEAGAGLMSGADDDAYAQAGASIVADMANAYAATLIIKVKEILPAEYDLLRDDHIVLTNHHTAASPAVTDVLLRTGVTAIAAEDTHRDGSPNCPLAGEVGALEGLRLAMAPHGGTGRHFFAHFGAPPLKAIVIGLGAVGRGALRTLLALGVEVAGFDVWRRARSESALNWSDKAFSAHDIDALPDHLTDADLIINCVLWPKDRDDHLIARSALAKLKPTAVIVDISCDEGGAIETTRATTWADPVYEVDGIRHFCVDNIPGAVPVAASAGYGQAMLPHALAIAADGALAACRADEWLARGLVCVGGTLFHAETARVQGREHTPVAAFLEKG